MADTPMDRSIGAAANSRLWIEADTPGLPLGRFDPVSAISRVAERVGLAVDVLSSRAQRPARNRRHLHHLSRLEGP